MIYLRMQVAHEAHCTHASYNKHYTNDGRRTTRYNDGNITNIPTDMYIDSSLITINRDVLLVVERYDGRGGGTAHTIYILTLRSDDLLRMC